MIQDATLHHVRMIYCCFLGRVCPESLVVDVVIVKLDFITILIDIYGDTLL